MTENSNNTHFVDTDGDLIPNGGTVYNEMPLIMNRPNSRISFDH
jgi:hypothetical protein